MLLKSFKHTILLKEVIYGLNIISDGVYVDGTFGQGGHSNVILSFLNQKGRLLAIDRDRQSVRIGKSIEKQDVRFTMIHGKFSRLFKYMKYYGLLGRVNGILLDLGLSRLQLENPERGFSFVHDGPLDMRMDVCSGVSAASWLSKATLERIIWVLKTYGEEKFARRIAKSIIMYRKKYELKYTNELVQLIINSIPWSDKYKHPATRTFQAIRIYINNELEEIKSALRDALVVLAPKGRLLVISFHSLEDRIVKFFIRQHGLSSSVMLNVNYKNSNKSFYDFQNTSIYNNNFIFDYNNKNYNCENIGGYNKCYLRLVERIFPSKEEVEDNTRARSAVLRCVEKVII